MSNNNKKFPSHFREFIEALNNNDVEYMLIGGYAMGAFGHIRGTNDLDIFINTTDDNASRMMNACKEYGIPEEEIKKEMFLVQKMIGIGQPPLRIELLKKLDAVDFEYAYKRKITKKVDDVLINVISMEDLTLLKHSAVKDRDKSRDLEDLMFLKKLKEKMNNKEKKP